MESTADPAAIFGAAQSLWTECHTRAQSEDAVHLSECFSGMDGLMREVMRIATMFEEWACQHADFAQLGEVWPYYLEDHFGAACLRARAITTLESFSEVDCLHVALQLRLPLRLDPSWRPAVDLIAENPNLNSPYRQLRVRSMRLSRVTGKTEPYARGDDPQDSDHTQPYYSLFGIDRNGAIERITDRATLPEIQELTKALFPALEFYRCDSM